MPLSSYKLTMDMVPKGLPIKVITWAFFLFYIGLYGQNVTDDFSTDNYSRGVNWAADWSGFSDSRGAAGGFVRVDAQRLRFR
ncbi:hypothetical protein [Maribacter sp. 2304DJ31-5]|uniref:hypothetical protein n=1 Tax=Maribacter sp. 2304DJ31-5 TaxID=3386273 RepID=UPI0039BCB851